jgi:hypothetical protein
MSIEPETPQISETITPAGRQAQVEDQMTTPHRPLGDRLAGPKGPFFIRGPIDGPDLQGLPVGTVVITPPAVPLPVTNGLSDPSAARAIVIPALARSAPVLPPGPVVFALATDKGESTASMVTMELLAQMADCGPEWWPLIAVAVGALQIDPVALRYRGPAACYPAVVPPALLMTGGGDKIDAWFGIHGYVQRRDAVQDLSGGIPGYRVYVRRANDPGLAVCAVVFLAEKRVSKGDKGETVPKHLLEAQRRATALSSTESAHPAVHVPAFFILPTIVRFASDWEEAAKTPRIFPALASYFDLAAGEHQMYPRFIPIPPHDDNVPIFHPGPALYSVISAPHAGRAAFFRADGSQKHFLCVRETFHKDPAVQCPGDPVQLGPL